MWLSKGLLGLSAQANSIEDLSSYINNFRESKLAPLWTFIQNNVTTTISFNQMSGPILLQLENLGSLVELYLGGNNFSGAIPSTFGLLLHRFEIETNQSQMKSTIESKRELNKSKFVLDKCWMNKLETLCQECSFRKRKEIEETKNTLYFVIHKLPKTILTKISKTKAKQHIYPNHKPNLIL